MSRVVPLSTVTDTPLTRRGRLAAALLAFHHRLARAQHDLPPDAARLLREHLWPLYSVTPPDEEASTDWRVSHDHEGRKSR